MPKSSARIGSSIGEADAGEGAAIGMGAARRRRHRVQSLAATAARAYGTKVQELLTSLAMDARIALGRPDRLTHWTLVQCCGGGRDLDLIKAGGTTSWS